MPRAGPRPVSAPYDAGVAPPQPTPVDLLLEQARAQARSGDVSAAWGSCTEAAGLARRTGDVAALADTAVVLRPSGDPVVNAAMHALCAEALHALGDADPVRSARLRGQLVATASPFLAETAPVARVGPRPDIGDPESVFLWLQARHAEDVGIDGLAERLRIADAAVELGRRTDTVEYVAWGRRWRLDGLLTLGRRLELDDELAALVPLVDRLGRADWRSALALVRAVRAGMQGDFPAARHWVGDAVAASPNGEARFFALVIRSELARHTGVDLEAVADEVAAFVDGLPFLARGWSAQLALDLGRREDAALWWRSITPLIGRMPRGAPEWVVAQAGHAHLCVGLGDTETAATLYDLLLPYRDLHVAVYAHSAYGGPVDLVLGRLAALRGDAVAAGEHLLAAEQRCIELAAWPHLALVQAALADLHGPASSAGRAYGVSALRLARRHGLDPLVQTLGPRLPGSAGPAALTSREREIAGLVAEGLSNAAIGGRLTLSVRTVENHVSHVLDKLDVGSRSGIAAWFVRNQGSRTP